MGRRGPGVGVIDIGQGLLLDRPHICGGVIDDLVGVLLTVLAGVGKLGYVVIDGGFQFFLEVPGNGSAADLGLDHKAADIALNLAIAKNIAILIQLIGLAVGGKAALPIGVGLQGGILYSKRGLRAVVSGVDNVLVGNGQQSTAGGNGIEVLPFLCQGVGHILIVKLRLAGHLSQQELGLGSGTELLSVGHCIAEILVLGHSHIFLGHVGVGIELLILSVGGDQSAHKREDKHDSQHNKAQNRQPVTEKPLGHQGAGGKDFHAAVIIQREVLLGAVLLLRIHLFFFRHESTSSYAIRTRGSTTAYRISEIKLPNNVRIARKDR